MLVWVLGCGIHSCVVVLWFVCWCACLFGLCWLLACAVTLILAFLFVIVYALFGLLVYEFLCFD